MTSYLLAGPAVEPVSLAEAKAWLKVETGEEDGLIATLVAAARLHIEGVTGRALIMQSWRKLLDDWPADGTIRLPVTPLAALTAITAYDPDGADHAIGLAQITMDGEALRLPPVVDGAPALRARQGIEIDYVAGFGDAPDDVPADLRQALLVLVAHWYENRDAVIVAGSGAVVPDGFDRLIARRKRVRM